jgi:hypothetical protein
LLWFSAKAALLLSAAFARQMLTGESGSKVFDQNFPKGINPSQF